MTTLKEKNVILEGLTTEFIDLRRPPVRPFVKWPGGKRQLLSELDKLIPS
jgi:hypothetical protein